MYGQGQGFESEFALDREVTLAEIMAGSWECDSSHALSKTNKASKLLTEFLSDPDIRAHRDLKSSK